MVIINQTLARSYFENEDPVGQKIKFSTFEEWAADWPRDAYFEIIGIIADAKNTGLRLHVTVREQSAPQQVST